MSNEFDLEKESFNTACWTNGYHSFTLSSKELGFKTNSMKRSHFSLKEQNIAEEFLVNSRMKKNDREMEASVSSYFDDSGLLTTSLVDEKDIPDTKIVPLSNGVSLTMSLGESMVLRRSRRYFTKDPMDFDYLSTIIRAGFGVSAVRKVFLSNDKTTVTHSLRMSPSGGGLYPVSLHVAILNVKKIDPGVYSFDPKSENLVQLFGSETLPELLKAYAGPKGVISTQEACAIFFLIGLPWRSLQKYGCRGLRFVFQEAGGIAQNIHLAATALGVCTVDCASFYDDELHKQLKIDGTHQTFLHSIFLGMS